MIWIIATSFAVQSVQIMKTAFKFNVLALFLVHLDRRFPIVSPDLRSVEGSP